jgi:hypothetical protein
MSAPSFDQAAALRHQRLSGRDSTPHLVDPSSFPVVLLLLVIRPAERGRRVDMPNAAVN